MEVHLSLQVGPLKAEITADSEENYERELVQLMDFIQSRQDQLSEISPSEAEYVPKKQAEEPNPTESGSTNQSGSQTAESDDGFFSIFARKSELSEEEISEIVDIDPNFEEPPLLLVDPDQLGESVPEQQFVGTILLLGVWNECYDETPIEISRVKDELEYCGISTSNFYRMYDLSVAKKCLRRSGDNQGATIRLTRAGERKVIERLEELAT